MHMVLMIFNASGIMYHVTVSLILIVIETFKGWDGYILG